MQRVISLLLSTLLTVRTGRHDVTGEMHDKLLQSCCYKDFHDETHLANFLPIVKSVKTLHRTEAQLCNRNVLYTHVT